MNQIRYCAENSCSACFRDSSDARQLILSLIESHSFEPGVLEQRIIYNVRGRVSPGPELRNTGFDTLIQRILLCNTFFNYYNLGRSFDNVMYCLL